MTEQEIIQNAKKYACPENSSLFNIEKERVMTHFIAGAQWADKTILKEVLRWLDDHTYDEQYLFNDTSDAVGITPYHTKETMLRSFKERFNIE